MQQNLLIFSTLLSFRQPDVIRVRRYLIFINATPGATRKTHPSPSEIAERMPKWWRSQSPRRAAPSPTLFAAWIRCSPSIAVYRAPFEYPIITHKKYSQFIQLFVFYMILTNGYCCTFRVLLSRISNTILLQYIILAWFF